MNLQTFDLNLLKVLDALLRDCSTVRAGQRIGLSQPAVSAALGRLRAAFDDPLLIRDGQALRPTEFALTLVEPVRELLEGAGALLASPPFDPSAATDVFRIAAADYFTEVLLPDLAARLQRDAPGVTLRYTDAIGKGAMDDLREGRMDLVILPDQTLPGWLDSEFLLHVDYRLVARRGHPVLKRHEIMPGQLITMDLYCQLHHAAFRVMPNEPELEERLIESLGYTRHVRMLAPSFTAVWQAVAATNLVGMIPHRMADRVAGRAGLEIYPMPYTVPRAELCHVWHRRNSSARGLIWLRGVVADILSSVDDGPAQDSASGR